MNQAVYFEAIRYRRWHELEEYAKWSPNQVLADTVSALAQTIGDKQDEKKLKKILFLLAQKGIRPFEGEKRAKKVPARQSLVGFACMGSPDRFGFCQFLVGVQNGRMGEAICFYANPFLHYCRVVEVHTVPFAQLRMIKHNFLTRCQAPIVSVVSLDFVRGRLACCIDRHYPDVHKGVPYEVPIFW